MKKLLILPLFTGIIFAQSLKAKEYAIVASKDFTKPSVSQIKALYLKKSDYVGDTKVIPLNLSAKNKIRRSFEKKVLHMSFNRLKSYWTKQHYLGHRPPITMKSQKSIQAFIKKVDGAIGYVELPNVDPKLQIIYKWSD